MEVTTPVAPPYVVQPFALLPFAALRMTPAAVGDPASARLFARPYVNLPGRVQEWEQKRQLFRDSERALYLHEYTADGITVRGLVGLLDLTGLEDNTDPERTVVPHEGVHAEQVQSLARRMRQTLLNPAPILMVHRAPSAMRRRLHQVVASSPEITFQDRQHQLHRIWPIIDPQVISGLGDDMQSTSAMIADGHHRFAGHLELIRTDPTGPWRRALAMLVDQNDTPLWLGPIHRFVRELDIDTLVQTLLAMPGVTGRFTDRTQALASLAPGTMVITDADRWTVIDLAGRTEIDEPEVTPVAVLDRYVVPKLNQSQCVSHHHTAESALELTRHRAGVAVLLPAPQFDDVLQSARSGQLLPEKATSFQPKPSVGAIMRDLRVE